MKSMIATLRKIVREKAEYKASRTLLKALSHEYQFVYKQIEKYMYNIMIDESVMPILMNTLESFAIAAAAGRPVQEVTGKDTGLFCDALIEKFQVKTWRDAQREILNNNVNAYCVRGVQIKEQRFPNN
jgi:DNA-binding ferritin-like protein (Dps family)